MGSEKLAKTEAAASGEEKSAPEMAEPLKTVNLDEDNDDQNDNQDRKASVENRANSSSSSQESDDSSSDDDVPLISRRGLNAAAGGSSIAALGNPPQKKPSEQPHEEMKKKKRAKDETSGASDSDTSNKKRRFAPVRKGGKCGKCDNCKNPHWKKACIEVRKAQEAAAAGGGGDSNGAASAAAVKTTKAAAAVVEKPAAAAIPPPAAKPAAKKAASTFVTTAKPLSNDQFSTSLGKLMASGGSIVQASHVPVLIDLMKRANTWGQRQSILTTMVLSINEVLVEVVHQKGLLILQKWFSEAIEGKRVKSLSSLLTTLDALPISMAALQPPCELGKLVGNLRKAPEELHPLKPQAAELIARWKAIVKQGDAAVSASVEKAVTVAVAATAKATAAAAETKAATTKAVAAASADAAKLKFKPPTTAVAATSSSKLGDDADLFGAADKRRAGAAAAPKAKPEATKPTTATASKRPMLAAKKSLDQSTSSSLLPSISVSSLSSLGGAAGGGGGGSSSSIGGISSSSGGLSFGSHMMLTGADRARQRAKEAAARVPSPEPAPRKEKKKKLGWKDGNALEDIRLFRRSDPPSAASKDVDLNEESNSTREPSPPPQFASAAKQEHLSEAHALRAHRQEEDEFRANYLELLAEMVPDVEWYDPPIIAAATAAEGGTTIATGEQSYEIAAAKARRAGLHPGAHTPTYPLEPNGFDRRPLQQMHTILRIPLSIDEAQAWTAQAQAQQQQQQQQHGFGRAPSGYGPPPPAAPHKPELRYASPPAPAGGAAQQPPPAAAAAAALPDGLSAAIAQLAASGALGAPPTTTTTSALPPGLYRQHYQPPQQQQHRQPPRMQPRGPALPPGMRPMLGLHRPAQPPPTTDSAPSAAPQPPAAQNYNPSMNGGGGGGRTRTPCRFFLSAEGCRHGNNCRFAHLPADQIAKRPRVDGGAPNGWDIQ